MRRVRKRSSQQKDTSQHSSGQGESTSTFNAGRPSFTRMVVTIINCNCSRRVRMRNFRKYIGVIALCWVMSAMAFVPHIDLKDAIVVAEGQCEHNARVYKCFMLKNEDLFYMLAVDNLGVVASSLSKNSSRTTNQMK